MRRPPALLALLSSIVLLLAGPIAPASACPDEAVVPGAVSAKRHAAAVRCLINVERRARGVAKLRRNGKLGRAARDYARQMAVRDFFSHVSPSGSTLGARVRRVRYRAAASAENIAWGAGRRGTPRALVNAWLRSPGHRSLLLSAAYRDVGVGTSLGSPAGRVARSATISAVFARRR